MTLADDITTILGNATALNTSLAPIIGRESTVKTITEREKARLNAKKTEIDDAYTTNKRLVNLNDSYRKKQAQYNYLMFIVVSFFVIMVIMMQIQKAVPAIGGILSFITFILGVVVFAYVVYLLADIYRRDPNDFDKINYAPPPNVDKTVIDPATGKASTVSTGLINPETGKKYDPSTDASRSRNNAVSVGQDACFPGHSYDYYSGKCIPDCTDPAKITNMMDPTLYKSNLIENGLNYDIFSTAFDRTAKCVAKGECTGNNKICGKFCIPKEYSCGASESFATLGDTVSANSPHEFSNYSPL
jgi:uncharacterized membrane protein (DUF485 family)